MNKDYIDEQLNNELNGTTSQPSGQSVQQNSQFIDPNLNKQLSGEAPISDVTVLPAKSEITQKFNTYNPDLETFSQGYSRDTNFAAEHGTPISTPPGQWKVEGTYNQDSPQGYAGNGDNNGYGNYVIVKNTKTGEKLLFEHMADVNVKPGRIVSGNVPLGSVGSSGNATGPNLGVEYYDENGNLSDILSSNYAKYFNISN